MGNTTSVLGIVQTNDEWTAWAAVGTIAAVIVALALPFLIGLAGKISAGRATRERYEEVRDATYSALLIYEEVRSANLSAISSETVVSARVVRAQSAAKVRYKARTLDKLSNLPALSDGAIDSLSAATVLMELLLRGVSPRNEKSDLVWFEAHTTAVEVQRRLAGMIRYRGLSMDREWPLIEDTSYPVRLDDRRCLFATRMARIWL